MAPIAVVVGDRFRAGSSELPAGRAADLVGEALDADGDDTAAVLDDFVERVGRCQRRRPGESAGSGDAGGEDGTGGNWVLPALLVGGAGVGGVLLWRSSRDVKPRTPSGLAPRRPIGSCYGPRFRCSPTTSCAWSPKSQLHPEAQSDFDAAVNRYRAAQAALDYADEPVDLVRVGGSSTRPGTRWTGHGRSSTVVSRPARPRTSGSRVITANRP